MERYFTKFATDAAYQADASNLPNPNVSLIEAHGGIRCKKGITTVAAPTLVNTVSEYDGEGNPTGSNQVYLACATPGAEIIYFVDQYYSGERWYQDWSDYNREEIEAQYNPDGTNDSWEEDFNRDRVTNIIKTTDRNDYNVSLNVYNPTTGFQVYCPESMQMLMTNIYAMAHIGNNWSELVPIYASLLDAYYYEPEIPEEPPYEEPYEEPYDEGGEP